jgi:hypothetical protein
MKKILSLTLCLFFSQLALAQTSTELNTNSTNNTSNFNGGGMAHHMPHNPAFEAALQECAGTVAKDSNGRPDHEAMRACLSSKGFNPPEHGPHNGGMPPPPQQQSGQ